MITLFEESIGILAPHIYARYHPTWITQLSKIIESRNQKNKYGIGREHWSIYKQLLLFFMGMTVSNEIPHDILRIILSLSFKAAVSTRIQDAITRYGWRFVTDPNNEGEVCLGTRSMVFIIPTTAEEVKTHGFYVNINIGKLVYVHDLFLSDEWVSHQFLRVLLKDHYEEYRHSVYRKFYLVALYLFLLCIDWFCYEFAITESIARTFFNPVLSDMDIFTQLTVNTIAVIIRTFLNPLRYTSGWAFLGFLWWQYKRNK